MREETGRRENSRIHTKPCRHIVCSFIRQTWVHILYENMVDKKPISHSMYMVSPSLGTSKQNSISSAGQHGKMLFLQPNEFPCICQAMESLAWFDQISARFDLPWRITILRNTHFVKKCFFCTTLVRLMTSSSLEEWQWLQQDARLLRKLSGFLLVMPCFSMLMMRSFTPPGSRALTPLTYSPFQSSVHFYSKFLPYIP